MLKMFAINESYKTAHSNSNGKNKTLHLRPSFGVIYVIILVSLFRNSNNMLQLRTLNSLGTISTTIKESQIYFDNKFNYPNPLRHFSKY